MVRPAWGFNVRTTENHIDERYQRWWKGVHLAIRFKRSVKFVFLCEHFFAHNACGFGKVHCFFSTVFLASFLQRVGKTIFEGQKETPGPCLFSSRAEIWERMRSFRRVVWMRAGVFSPSCFKRDVYLPTGSASLKTGSIAVLTMRNFSIKETSSA